MNWLREQWERFTLWRTRSRRQKVLEAYWLADSILDAAYYRIHSPDGRGCTAQCRNLNHTKRPA